MLLSLIVNSASRTRSKYNIEMAVQKIEFVYVDYTSVQSLLSSHLLSKILKIRIYKTIILTVVLYGCETWSQTLGVCEQSAEEDIWTEEG
jgi:hypothetical protein